MRGEEQEPKRKPGLRSSLPLSPFIPFIHSSGSAFLRVPPRSSAFSGRKIPKLNCGPYTKLLPPQMGFQESFHLGRLGLAPGGLHHLSHEEPDGVGFAFTVILYRVLVLRQDLPDNGFEPFYRST